MFTADVDRGGLNIIFQVILCVSGFAFAILCFIQLLQISADTS